MHVGFVDWKDVGDEINFLREKGLVIFSKCLFSIVKLKSPMNKILSYFVEDAFIALDIRLLIKNYSFWLCGL